MNVRFRRAESIYEQGEYKEAIKEFQKFLDLYPDNGLAKEYIKKANEKIRLKAASLAQQIEQERKLQNYEARLASVKAKEEMRLAKKRQKQERYRNLIDQKVKQELALKSGQGALLSREIKKELFAKARQDELIAQAQTKLMEEQNRRAQFNQDRARDLMSQRIRRELLTKAKQDELISDRVKSKLITKEKEEKKQAERRLKDKIKIRLRLDPQKSSKYFINEIFT